MRGDLAAAVQQSAVDNNPNGIRIGTVKAVNSTGTGARVTVNGADLPNGTQFLTCISSYYPVVGDVVALLRQDASWLVLGATSRTTQFSRYTGGATALTSGAWNELPFGTLVEGPGLTQDGSGLFTLGKAGIWTVTFAVNVAPGASTAVFAGLFDSVARTNVYATGYSSAVANLEAVAVSADIISNGTTQVCAQVFAQGTGASVAASSGLPRLTLRLNP